MSGRAVFRVTFETYTEESTMAGDAESRGFLSADGDRLPVEETMRPDFAGVLVMDLRAALALVQESPGDLEYVDPSDSQYGNARYVTLNYRTHGPGDQIGESLSIHFPDNATSATRARLVSLLSS